MTTHYPSMTGLESHMETEIAKQARRADEALEQAKQMRGPQKRSRPPRVTEMDVEIEEAMHLAR